ncbi:hypothetical protein [Rhodococcus globerulus]|uniref:hypothetical protein n=1 Tax=Rhodococcus globerulus TaxID=33008 RepID=UPI003017C878
MTCISVAPWIIATGSSTWLSGAAAASASALVLTIPDVYRRPKILDIVTIVFFTALTVAGIIASPVDGEWIDQYSGVISSAALAAIALGSLLFVPFTEQSAGNHPRRILAHTNIHTYQLHYHPRMGAGIRRHRRMRADRHRCTVDEHVDQLGDPSLATGVRCEIYPRVPRPHSTRFGG